jgi:prefoldin subunit 5
VESKFTFSNVASCISILVTIGSAFYVTGGMNARIDSLEKQFTTLQRQVETLNSYLLEVKLAEAPTQ